MNLILPMKGTSAISRYTGLIAVAFLVVIGACDSTSTEPETIPLETQMAEDIPADPASGRDTTTGRAISNNLFTLYCPLR